jgi:prepilin-type N-terminal cleavage/methylation domain-containing protein
MCAKYDHRIVVEARRGITLIELTIAVAIFAVLLTTTVKMIMAASNQVRANERRQVALQAAQAISEQIENIPWDQLTTDAASQVPFPEAAMSHLSGAKLNVAVNDENDPLAKRIAVEITWNGRGAERAAPIRLTSWAFPDVAPAAQ